MSFSVKEEGSIFDRKRVLQLASRACAECLSDAEFRELENVLRVSAEARELYREYTNIHVTLGSCFGAATQSVSPGKIETMPVEFKPTSTIVTVAPEVSIVPVAAAAPAVGGSHSRNSGGGRSRALLAAAASVAIGIGMGAYFLIPRGDADAPLAMASTGEAPASLNPTTATPTTAIAADAGADSDSGTGSGGSSVVAATSAAGEIAKGGSSTVSGGAKEPRELASLPPENGLAVVRDFVTVKWPKKGRRIAKDKWMTSRSALVIEGGLARVQFRDGALLTLRGPALLRILSGNSAKLEYGEIYSMVPPSATGFKVGTTSVNVIDVGTAFGMSASREGVVELQVYDGEVHLHAPDEAPGAFEGVKKLYEGDAIVARASTGSKKANPAARKTAFEKATFGASAFQRLQSVNAGLIRTSQQVRLAGEGPNRHLKEYEHNRLLYVFPERRRVHLDEPLEVAFTEPGEYANVASETSQRSVIAGTTVRSYLLQFNPVGKPEKGHPFKGSITFDQPIVGVITQGDRLVETDALFAPDLSFYRNFVGRAMDANALAEPGAKRAGDMVTLGESRRTLQINWNATNSIDQIRVLVLDERY